MSKELKHSWILCFPGYWKTREGHVLQKIDRPAKRSHAWYKFRNHEFEVRGSFQAQLKAEELMKSDLETFKKALEKAEHISIGG